VVVSGEVESRGVLLDVSTAVVLVKDDHGMAVGPELSDVVGAGVVLVVKLLDFGAREVVELLEVCVGVVVEVVMLDVVGTDDVVIL